MVWKLLISCTIKKWRMAIFNRHICGERKKYSGTSLFQNVPFFNRLSIFLQDEDTLAVTSALLQKKTYKDLADFDNHLDDLTQDYLNVAVNMEINKCSQNHNYFFILLFYIFSLKICKSLLIFVCCPFQLINTQKVEAMNKIYLSRALFLKQL